MPDTALPSMTAVTTPSPTTDLIYVVQSGPVDRKGTPSQYVGNFNIDATDAGGLRRGTNAQTLRIYGTYTDASNYERFSISYTAGAYVIGSENAGTGQGRVVQIQTGNTTRWQVDTSGHVVPLSDSSYDIGQSSTAFRPRHIYVGTSVTLGSGAALNQGGAAGAATTANRLIIKKTGIADNTTTDILTVTVPNANHAAAIKLTILSSNGSTDAFESSRCAEGMVILARTTGVATVAATATLELAQIATVAAGATHTLAYGVSAMTGADGATQTFTIQLTIDDSGDLGSNQAVILAELINAEASGVTMAAA